MFDRAEAQQLRRDLGVDALVGKHTTLLDLTRAIQRIAPTIKHRATFADLAFAAWLENHARTVNDAAALLEVYLARNLPRRAGDLPPDQLLAAAYVTSALRDVLTRLLPTSLAEVRELDTSRQLALVYAWDHLFLNAMSPLHLLGAPPREPTEIAGVAGLLVESMWNPWSAPADVEVEGLWQDGAPTIAKLLTSLWLINLPVHEIPADANARSLNHMVALCCTLRASPPPAPLLFAFTHAALTCLFRAGYGEGDPTQALAAVGDLVAEMMQRAFPAYATPRPRKAREGLPRIGYVSTNFRAHAVAFYMANRIVARDRTRFHVTTFVLGPKRDAMTLEIAQASDQVVQLPRALDYGAVAQAIASADLDLLIFVDLGMELATYLIAGLHLAPRQIVMMGHAASSGLPTVSTYLSGDHEADDAQRFYRERLVRLPDLGAAQHPPPPPAGSVTRADLKIPADAVVFVSCANALKHGVDRDDLLAEILARAPNAWVVLKPFFNTAEIDQRVSQRIRAAAERRGVADRLVIVPPLASVAGVMDLYALADVQLDTFPFGGWTTNLESIFAGLPIVTQDGAAGRSRWGARLLRLVGIEHGIAADAASYVDAAVRLAEDAELRASIRETLAAARSIVFSPSRTQPAFEAALQAILDDETG